MGTMRLRDVNGDWRERERLRGAAVARVWGEFLGRVSWELSASLTFDAKKVYPVGRELASREAFWWLGVVAHLCRRPVGWAYVTERGRTGLWHAHALLVGAGRPNRRILEGVWRMRNGIAVIRPVHSATEISLYVSKQATDGEVVLSDTMTLTRFKELATDVVVPLVAEDE